MERVVRPLRRPVPRPSTRHTPCAFPSWRARLSPNSDRADTTTNTAIIGAGVRVHRSTAVALDYAAGDRNGPPDPRARERRAHRGAGQRRPVPGTPRGRGLGRGEGPGPGAGTAGHASAKRLEGHRRGGLGGVLRPPSAGPRLQGDGEPGRRPGQGAHPGGRHLGRRGTPDQAAARAGSGTPGKLTEREIGDLLDPTTYTGAAAGLVDRALR